MFGEEIKRTQRPWLAHWVGAKAQAANGPPGQVTRAGRSAELIKSHVDRASAANASTTVATLTTPTTAVTTLTIRATALRATTGATRRAAATVAAPQPAATATSGSSAAGHAAATRAFRDRRDHLSRPALPRGQVGQLVDMPVARTSLRKIPARGPARRHRVAPRSPPLPGTPPAAAFSAQQGAWADRPLTPLLSTHQARGCHHLAQLAAQPHQGVDLGRHQYHAPARLGV
eukprot:scaffold56046_cov43-Phaeocystis_antarctica.AAC.2